MFLSLFNCHFTYCLICSSSSPTVLTQYPFAQKCLPQYRFSILTYLSNIFIALLPFRNPTTSEIEYFGGNDNTRWIWSFCTLPSNISIFFHSHNSLIISRTDLPTSPFKTVKRYFGHHTMWYLHFQTVCDELFSSCSFRMDISRVQPRLIIGNGALSLNTTA